MNEMKMYLRNIKKTQFQYSLTGLVDAIYILLIFIIWKQLPYLLCVSHSYVYHICLYKYDDAIGKIWGFELPGKHGPDISYSFSNNLYLDNYIGLYLQNNVTSDVWLISIKIPGGYYH